MNIESNPPGAVGEYAAAYAVHYVQRDLPLALQLYRSLAVSHPGSAEAGYSENQIANIARSVVPKQELLDAHVELAFAHFARATARDLIPIRDPAIAQQPSPHKVVPV